MTNEERIWAVERRVVVEPDGKGGYVIHYQQKEVDGDWYTRQTRRVEGALLKDAIEVLI